MEKVTLSLAFWQSWDIYRDNWVYKRIFKLLPQALPGRGHPEIRKPSLEVTRAVPRFKPGLSGVAPQPSPGCWGSGLHDVALHMYTDDLIRPH